MDHAEIVLEASATPEPYLRASVDVVFSRGGGDVRRPAFWDGGTTWRARFAAPEAGDWEWRTQGLPGGEQRGVVEAPRGSWLTMSRRGRNALWNDGRAFFPVADTAWALPYRATREEAERYADSRAGQGFTAALMMTVQPDLDAEGPEDRTQVDGFGRGFHDLPKGRLQDLNVAYFQHLDELVLALLRRGIVPIHTPLFSGYGWKGLRPIGTLADPDDARRFARMLLARYGAWPALWLVGGDGTGYDPGVAPMGETIARLDANRQPIGIHYNPWQTSDAHWKADWCDFHLCQTGHDGDHRPDRVAEMHARQPVRAVANGEPTYEGMGGGQHGLGDWQRVEAWENLMAGGTFGAFYGAGGVWQWQRPGETFWPAWASSGATWIEALEFEGARYSGVLGRLLTGRNFADMTPDVSFGRARRALRAGERFGLVYVPNGGYARLGSFEVPGRWTAFDARTGEPRAEGVLPARTDEGFMGAEAPLPADSPSAVVCQPNA